MDLVNIIYYLSNVLLLTTRQRLYQQYKRLIRLYVYLSRWEPSYSNLHVNYFRTVRPKYHFLATLLSFMHFYYVVIITCTCDLYNLKVVNVLFIINSFSCLVVLLSVYLSLDLVDDRIRVCSKLFYECEVCAGVYYASFF